MTARPIWNLIGVGLPVLVAAALFLWLSRTTHGNERMAIAVVMMVVIPVGCLIGLVASIVGLVRGEMWPWMGVVGVLGNGGLLLWAAQWLRPN